MEKKFIITKDGKHFKSEELHHITIAENNGYKSEDIVERGIFLDNHLFIMECENQRHFNKKKIEEQYKLNVAYNTTMFRNWLKGRELESQLYCRRNIIGLREGD